MKDICTSKNVRILEMKNYLDVPETIRDCHPLTNILASEDKTTPGKLWPMRSLEA